MSTYRGNKEDCCTARRECGRRAERRSIRYSLTSIGIPAPAFAIKKSPFFYIIITISHPTSLDTFANSGARREGFPRACPFARRDGFRAPPSSKERVSDSRRRNITSESAKLNWQIAVSIFTIFFLHRSGSPITAGIYRDTAAVPR